MTPKILVLWQIRGNSVCVCVVSQERGQPLRLLLCPFIIAHSMDLFEVWPQLNLAEEITIYSQLGKCCSIGTAPKIDLSVISSQGRSGGGVRVKKVEQVRERKRE